MTDFTASDGRAVWRGPGDIAIRVTGADGFPVVAVGSHYTDAVAEFFRHEVDEHHKRERSAIDPDIVVYRWGRDTVFVLDERTGQGKEFERAFIESTRNAEPANDYARAARAFFDAHPEPKPWHEAKIGDTWRLEPFGVNYNVVGVDMGVKFVRGDAFLKVDVIGVDDPRITAARRIWPVS